ncbi:hypothetical protein AB684_11610 [Bacillus licheniformis]|uniref:hypothetical protein n=1 Tax=Bacillus TaxID=1386 RepID=UPI0002ED170C|nr:MULTISPECIES: hypothetical protein [Bacillus subtilis group]AMR10799.1 hypothetical protein AB684_11610 [Bacillus licheniformis]KJH58683.1 hypothetical protein UF14_09730 [Bacillus licheniformis]KYC83490.1 hypothetical protein B4091_2068 [Bacillus licheniformis]MCM3374212.1 hypothetical protein [Bacillus licheniformis]MCM3433633.1 hypothetical protein [Bacillus licheniformis]
MKIELNNARRDTDVFANPKLSSKSPMVEIFSDVALGNDLSKHGNKVDTVMKHIKDLAAQAVTGNPVAKAEINTIVRFAVEPKLLSAVKLFDFMGTFRQIGYDEQPMMTTYAHESIRSNFQASRGDVPFATTTWNEYPIGTQTISSGYAVNYREIQSGNLDRVAEGMSQVQVDMMNKAMYYVVNEMYNSIKNATGVKYFAETAGIAKSSVDDLIKKVRRFGQPAIVGDYSVVSQLNDFAGFEAVPKDPATTKLSEAVMEEIRKTGLLNAYKGSSVVELPNAYNLTELNKAGDNFKTYLPEGLLFFIPQGGKSPLQVFQRGGLTSMTGNDIVTGTEMTRFDMEIGAGVAKGQEYQIGLIRDENFEIVPE